MQKGPLIFFYLCKGALKKHYHHKFSNNNRVEMIFLWGWPIIFMAKRGPWNFLRSERGGAKMFAICFFFLHQAHLTSENLVNGLLLFTNPSMLGMWLLVTQQSSHIFPMGCHHMPPGFKCYPYNSCLSNVKKSLPWFIMIPS